MRAVSRQPVAAGPRTGRNVAAGLRTGRNVAPGLRTGRSTRSGPRPRAAVCSVRPPWRTSEATRLDVVYRPLTSGRGAGRYSTGTEPGRYPYGPEAHAPLRRCVGRAGRGPLLGRYGARPLHAFTLVEMLVSLAVLGVALAVVGVVFSVTTKTASQSAAYAEVHARVREFVRQIKQDLNSCNPSESVLVLVGRTQAASLTQPDFDAGKYHRTLLGDPNAVAPGYDPEYALNVDPQYSDPRADILMFFTNRPTPSAAPNPNANPALDPYALGVKFTPIRVVYGHAAFGQPVWNAGVYQFPLAGNLRHIEQIVNVGTSVVSGIPANRWHLARVGTIIDSNVPSGTIQFSADACANLPAGAYYHESGAGYPNWDMPGDAAFVDLAATLQRFGFAASLPQSPYAYPATWDPNLVSAVNSLVFATHTSDPNSTPNQPRHVATVLDEVPVDLKSNLAVQMLPGCAWLQVEFLMPEDPRNSVTYAANPNNPAVPNPSRRSDMPRWTQVAPNSTYVFVPDTRENREAIIDSDPNTPGAQLSARLADFGRLDQDINGDTARPETIVSSRIIRMWPYAIRVTVRVWDSRGVLAEPIVRSVVHRFE